MRRQSVQCKYVANINRFRFHLPARFCYWGNLSSSIGRFAYRPGSSWDGKMIHGYMISSADSQDVSAQLKAAGCDKIHRDTRDTGRSERARRRRAIEQLSTGDV